MLFLNERRAGRLVYHRKDELRETNNIKREPRYTLREISQIIIRNKENVAAYGIIVNQGRTKTNYESKP